MFLELLNIIHANIKFRIEVRNERTIRFLDVLVYRKPDGKLNHEEHQKLTPTEL